VRVCNRNEPAKIFLKIQNGNKNNNKITISQINKYFESFNLQINKQKLNDIINYFSPTKNHALTLKKLFLFFLIYCQCDKNNNYKKIKKRFEEFKESLKASTISQAPVFF